MEQEGEEEEEAAAAFAWCLHHHPSSGRVERRPEKKGQGGERGDGDFIIHVYVFFMFFWLKKMVWMGGRGESEL
jgi:hypothetical protein